MNSSNIPKVNMLRLELLWWMVTFIVLIMVLLPIAIKLQAFPFWISNTIFVLTFITTTRYIFLLSSTFLARRFWVKLILIFLSIPIIFFLIQELNTFQTYLDEQGVEAIVGNLPFAEQQSMYQYVRNEMLLFGTGAIIGSFILPFRLMLSIWRVWNGKNRV